MPSKTTYISNRIIQFVFNFHRWKFTNWTSNLPTVFKVTSGIKATLVGKNLPAFFALLPFRSLFYLSGVGWCPLCIEWASSYLKTFSDNWSRVRFIENLFKNELVCLDDFSFSSLGPKSIVAIEPTASCVITLPTLCISSAIDSIISHLLFIIQILHRILFVAKAFPLQWSAYLFCCVSEISLLEPCFQINATCCLCVSVFFFLFNHGFWSVLRCYIWPKWRKSFPRISFKNRSGQ